MKNTLNFLAGLFFFASTAIALAAPNINAFSPMYGAAGDRVTIYGTGFADAGGPVSVTFTLNKTVATEATSDTVIPMPRFPPG